MVVSVLKGLTTICGLIKMTSLLCSKGLWMYLEKPLLIEDDGNCDSMFEEGSILTVDHTLCGARSCQSYLTHESQIRMSQEDLNFS